MIEQDKIKNKEKWYAIITRPRAERKVHARLLLSGFEVYLPLVTSVKQWSDRKKKVTAPLIPSYVFVKTTSKELSAVLGEFGVVRVLKYLKVPAIIHDHEIDTLKVLEGNAEDITVLDRAHFSKGEQVKIVKGPFEGLDALCVQFQGKHRIIVQTIALGISIEVNVPMSFIEKVRLQAAV